MHIVPILHGVYDQRILHRGGGSKNAPISLLNQKSGEPQIWHTG